MGSQLPFRLPCEVTKPVFYLGSPFNHGLAPALVDKYVNVSVVPSPTGDGTTVPPYERGTQDQSGDLSCEVHSLCNDPNLQACVPWIGVDQTPRTIQYNAAEPPPDNWKHTPGDEVNFAVNHKTGFKNVMAARLWHGTFGCLSSTGRIIDGDCPDNLCYGPGGAGNLVTWLSYQQFPDQTKYLTVTYDQVFNSTSEDGGSSSASLTGSRTVNTQSGEITSTVSSTQTNIDGTHGYIVKFSLNGAGYLADPDTGAQTETFTHNFGTVLDNQFPDPRCGYPQFYIGVNADLPTFINEWNNTHSTQMPLMTDPNNYSTGGMLTSLDSGVTERVSATFTRTNTSVSWDFYTDQDEGLGEGPKDTFHYTGTISFSNTNTSQNVYDDICKNMLVLWPLNDDELMPWRPDAFVGAAPLVIRREVASGPVTPCGFNPFTVDDLTQPINDAQGNAPFTVNWSPTYNQRAWFDPAVYQWQFPAGMSVSNSAASGLIKMLDGGIIGGPKPAGYQDPFDYNYLDMRGCCNNDGVDPITWDWYQLGWGMSPGGYNNTFGGFLPRNATHFTNPNEGINKPEGAWIIYADNGDYYGAGCVASNPSKVVGSGAIWACKFAAILDLNNSQNFARPAGADKFTYDETQPVYSATIVSAGTLSLLDANGNPPPDGTNFPGIWGGPVAGGFYNGVSHSVGGIVTLGQKVSNVPSNWQSQAGAQSGGTADDSGVCFGQLRFQNAPSLLGRAAVSVGGSGLNFTFAPAQPNFGMSAVPATLGQEQIDIYDASMNLLGTDTATRVDDSHFTTPNAYPKAAFVTISGVKYCFNDSDPKGDYAVLEWSSDFRNPGEGNRLASAADCNNNPIPLPATITYANADGNGNAASVNFPGNGFSQFIQRAGCVPFAPCGPKVVCISPNNEQFANGTTYAFPASFSADEAYGSKWWGWVQATMTDLLWQPPHTPVGIVKPNQGETITFSMDDPFGNDACSQPSDTDGNHVRFYRYEPQVETLLSLPCKYGLLSNECPPALPPGIQIGWLSPVANTGNDVPLPPAPPGVGPDGRPSPARTAWLLHAQICAERAGNCYLNYILPGC